MWALFGRELKLFLLILQIYVHSLEVQIKQMILDIFRLKPSLKMSLPMLRLGTTKWKHVTILTSTFNPQTHKILSLAPCLVDISSSNPRFFVDPAVLRRNLSGTRYEDFDFLFVSSYDVHYQIDFNSNLVTAYAFEVLKISRYFQPDYYLEKCNKNSKSSKC